MSRNDSRTGGMGRWIFRAPAGMRRRAFLPALFALAGLLVISAPAHAGWDGCTLVTADGHQQEHLSVNTWNANQGLSATNAQGNLVTIPSRDILSLSSGSQSARQIAHIGWEVRLRNGDVLYGPSAGKVQGNYLLFDAPDIDQNLAIPLNRVVAIIAPGAARPPASGAPDPPGLAPAPVPILNFNNPGAGVELHLPDPGADDMAILKEGGDQLTGEFVSLEGQSVQFKVHNTTTATTIDTSRLSALVLGGAHPLRKVPPLSVRLTFASSILTVPMAGPGKEAFSWALAQATITDAMGAAHQVPTSRILSIEVLGGRAVYLTDLDPQGEDQVTFLGSAWPYQINKNVMGQPLQVGKSSFDRGIGVHTQSTLTYTLAPNDDFQTLSLRVGLDDSAAPLGTAKASIVFNGKTLWHADALKPGEVSQVITLPIKGGGQLELHADPTSHLDVQGRVDWIEPMLLRN